MMVSYSDSANDVFTRTSRVAFQKPLNKKSVTMHKNSLQNQKSLNLLLQEKNRINLSPKAKTQNLNELHLYLKDDLANLL